MITADHTVLDDDQEPRLHHRNVVVGQDLATQGIQSYPREPNQLTRRREISENSHVQKKTQDPFIRDKYSGIYQSLRRAELES